MKKRIIWLIGSNASGKTTQSKLLHQKLGKLPRTYHQWEEAGHKVKYTTYGPKIGHVGIVGDNQCTGTDTINSRQGLEMSLIYCLNECDTVVVDGIMATSTWIDIFTQFPDTVEVYCILLQFPDVIANLRRVCERRLYKKIDKQGGPDADDFDCFDVNVDQMLSELEDKTIKNVSGKFSGFKSMFEKVKGRCQKAIEIDASLDIEQINMKILHFLGCKGN